ncbi:cupin family protein [Striga hermonthica]|uniref:Cupin family protein n=1 Tax=Striga hermonthica TaxID=68872 RepID=A0A9N7MZM9_STRHE|nr:cupin family protein [Striga hermonthica]
MGTKLIVLLLLLSFSLLLFGANCYNGNPEKEGRREEEEEEEESPEERLFKCLMSCEKQNDRELSPCEERCVREYQDTKRQQEPGSRENHHQPEEQYKRCQSKCAIQEHGQQRQYCQQKCQWQYEKQKSEHEGHGGGEDALNSKKKFDGKDDGDNPYFFHSRFESKYKTKHGHIKVLQRFSDKSELLRGVENYRLAILEANPNTFVLPHHCDAESILFVVGGRGTISYVWQNKRYSFNLKRGDVMRVPSGSLMYLVNQDDDERLYVLKLLQPVNTPGRVKEYFGVGADSFFRIFSSEILEAAFNSPSERLEKLFGQQKQGVIIKASKEQIRSLSQESESTGGTSELGSWGRPFSLLHQQPLFSSNYGQYFEASPINHRQLKDLDVSVGFMHIKSGGMVAPYYNSRSTKLVFVVGGSGQYEMACPHLSEQSKHNSQGVRYGRVSARLSIGDAFVIPAGHPIAIVASQHSNLQLASFGIKGSFDQKHFLAGQENIWNEVEPEAKELAFKMPAREVEDIFRSQEVSYFMPGPRHHEQKGKGQYVASIWGFVGF